MPTAQELHAETLNIAVRLQGVSKGNESPNWVVAALYSITVDTLRMHRAIGVLVEAGWATEAAVLVRTILDLNVSAAAIVGSKKPQLAAFKYFWTGSRDVYRDQAYSAADRRACFAEVRKAYNMLPPEDRPEAIEAFKDKRRAYWFAPEFSGPIDVVTKFGIEGMPFIYGMYSSIAHGGFLGGQLHSDDLAEQHINPRLPIGPRARSVLLTSSRYVAALLDIRDHVEGLGMTGELETLRLTIIEAMKENDRL